MDLLREAMNESKTKLSSRKRMRKTYLPSSSDSDSDDQPAPRKKFLTRGEMAKIEELKLAEEAKLAQGKSNTSSSSSSSSSSSTTQTEADTLDEKGDDENNTGGERIESKQLREELFSTREVQLRLRRLGQPISLFGESASSRLQRLKDYEDQVHSTEHGAMGEKNALKDLAAEVENEILQATMSRLEDDADEEHKKRSERKEARALKKSEKYKTKRTLESFKHKEDYIIFFFKRMLHEWEETLNNRPDAVKRTHKGKSLATTQKQTRDNIKPLMKLLQRRSCPDDILKETLKIVLNCDQREYVRANEAYLLLAIGNAAWPMGVTSVGIHERAGREKIFSQKQSHVLNSELQRKYVQAVKRIMTFCQTKYPNVPSKNIG